MSNLMTSRTVLADGDGKVWEGTHTNLLLRKYYLDGYAISCNTYLPDLPYTSHVASSCDVWQRLLPSIAGVFTMPTNMSFKMTVATLGSFQFGRETFIL